MSHGINITTCRCNAADCPACVEQVYSAQLTELRDQLTGDEACALDAVQEGRIVDSMVPALSSVLGKLSLLRISSTMIELREIRELCTATLREFYHRGQREFRQCNAWRGARRCAFAIGHPAHHSWEVPQPGPGRPR